jgi:predicted peroxiredoxin
VTLFLAGDAAYLVKDAVIENLQGIGTGALRETLPTLVEAEASILVSGMSSRSCGVPEEDLAGKRIEFAGPPQLVELTLETDRVLCY